MPERPGYRESLRAATQAASEASSILTSDPKLRDRTLETDIEEGDE